MFQCDGAAKSFARLNRRRRIAISAEQLSPANGGRVARWAAAGDPVHRGCNMFNMSTHSLKELRSRLGAIVREVAATGEEVIVTDSGTEVAVIIGMADYERLHEHADVADALRLRSVRERPFAAMSMSEMLEALGVDPAAVRAS